jgi:protein gp37
MKYYNKTTIDWPFKPLYTFNPIVGCKHNCHYCYARRMNDRFKWVDEWTKPEYFPERLSFPTPNKPSFIFIGSMCDLFGKWVTIDIIKHIIQHCKNNPKHIWIFLTKNPERYSKFKFPDNCWLGATVTDFTTGLDTLLDFKTSYNSNCRTFLSIEPLLGEFKDVTFSSFDLIIVGVMSGPNAFKPSLEQVKSIEHFNIWYKKSIRDIYPEFKNGESMKNPFWIDKREWDFLKYGK